MEQAPEPDSTLELMTSPRRSRSDQVVADGELIRTWQMFRSAMGLVDSRLVSALTQDRGAESLVHEALAELAAAPGHALPTSDLVPAAGLSAGEVNVVVDELVERGFAYRRHSTSNRCVVDAVLTAEGVKHEQRSTPAHVEHLRAEFDALGVEQIRALQMICQQIQNDFPEVPPRGLGGDGRG